MARPRKPLTLAQSEEIFTHIMLPTTPFYSLAELHQHIKSFITHLNKNKKEIIKTGLCLEPFYESPWLDTKLSSLYYTEIQPIRFTFTNGTFDANQNWINESPVTETYLRKHAEEPNRWLRNFSIGDIDKHRKIILKLKLETLQKLYSSMLCSTADQLLNNCFQIIGKFLAKEDLDFFLRLDRKLRFFNVIAPRTKKYTKWRITPGGLSDLTEVIFFVAQEIEIHLNSDLKKRIKNLPDIKIDTRSKSGKPRKTRINILTTLDAPLARPGSRVWINPLNSNRRFWVKEYSHHLSLDLLYERLPAADKKSLNDALSDYFKNRSVAKNKIAKYRKRFIHYLNHDIKSRVTVSFEVPTHHEDEFKRSLFQIAKELELEFSKKIPPTIKPSEDPKINFFGDSKKQIMCQNIFFRTNKAQWLIIKYMFEEGKIRFRHKGSAAINGWEIRKHLRAHPGIKDTKNQFGDYFRRTKVNLVSWDVLILNSKIDVYQLSVFPPPPDSKPSLDKDQPNNFKKSPFTKPEFNSFLTEDTNGRIRVSSEVPILQVEQFKRSLLQKVKDLDLKFSKSSHLPSSP